MGIHGMINPAAKNENLTLRKSAGCRWVQKFGAHKNGDPMKYAHRSMCKSRMRLCLRE